MGAVVDAPIQPTIGFHAGEDRALAVLVDRLVKGLDPQAVWLFGSRGRGDHRPDSDYDLLVVARPGADWGSDDYDRVYATTMGTGLGCDVVPISSEDFEEAATLRTTLVSTIIGEGRKIYEGPR